MAGPVNNTSCCNSALSKKRQFLVSKVPFGDRPCERETESPGYRIARVRVYYFPRKVRAPIHTFLKRKSAGFTIANTTETLQRDSYVTDVRLQYGTDLEATRSALIYIDFLQTIFEVYTYA